MRVIREFSQRKSQRLLSSNKNRKKRNRKILTWSFSHLLPSHIPKMCIYPLVNQKGGWREAPPWCRKALSEPHRNSVIGTWNSLEYKHGLWVPPFLFNSKMFLIQIGTGHGAAQPAQRASGCSISYQFLEKSCWDVLLLNAVWVLGSDGTVGGTSQGDKML